MNIILIKLISWITTYLITVVISYISMKKIISNCEKKAINDGYKISLFKNKEYLKFSFIPFVNVIYPTLLSFLPLIGETSLYEIYKEKFIENNEDNISKTNSYEEVTEKEKNNDLNNKQTEKIEKIKELESELLKLKQELYEITIANQSVTDLSSPQYSYKSNKV